MFALSIALDVATIAAGILIRTGRLWLLVVNYVAVLGFLDLLRVGASPVALVMAIVDAGGPVRALHEPVVVRARGARCRRARRAGPLIGRAVTP